MTCRHMAHWDAFREQQPDVGVKVIHNDVGTFVTIRIKILNT